MFHSRLMLGYVGSNVGAPTPLVSWSCFTTSEGTDIWVQELEKQHIRMKLLAALSHDSSSARTQVSTAIADIARTVTADFHPVVPHASELGD